MVRYKASGYVLGKLWRGGMGGVAGYPADDVRADSLSELEQQIKDGIADGSLDSGMGFESLIGAVMTIDAIDERKIDGKLFVAHEYSESVYGDLTDEQIEQLEYVVNFNS